MATITFPRMLYKAMRADNGQTICVHEAYIHKTTRVVGSPREYEDALSEGWFDSSNDALAAFDAEQDALSTAEAERAYDDRRMSDKAKAEADAVDRAGGFGFRGDIPEAPKKGRTKKGE